MSNTTWDTDSVVTLKHLYVNGNLLVNGVQVQPPGSIGIIATTGNAETLLNKTLPQYMVIAATSLTAAGTTRANALALTADTNNLTTVASSTGVVLPSIPVGAKVTVYNNGANPVKVYAPGSYTIDGTAGSTGVTLTNAKRCQYECVATNTILSAQLGVTSA